MVSLTTVTVVSAYLLSTAMYSVFLKRIPFIELLVLASGFVLRAIAGAYASDVVPSMWFLGCILCGSLFVALRKRYTEFQMGNSILVSTRLVLTKYSESMLRIMSQIAGGVFVFTYTGWAVATTNEITKQSVLRIASVVPFAAAVVWFERKTTQERGEAPEDIFINDRLLQILGLFWFGIAVLWALLSANGVWAQDLVLGRELYEGRCLECHKDAPYGHQRKGTQQTQCEAAAHNTTFDFFI